MTLNEEYWSRVRARAKALGSDGCTAVSEWNHDCCLHHDIMCRTGQDIDGNPVTRQEADYLFWECNRRMSRFSWLSPRSWWRWIGVRFGAWWEQRSRE
jgi:hypothetical protein